MATDTSKAQAGLVPKLLTIAQAAEEMTCSRRTIWRLAGRGELRIVRLGRAVRIDAASIAALIQRGGAA